MSVRSLLSRSIVALAGASMLFASLIPASAFTLGAPSPAQAVASSQIENVWYCRWNCGGWHPGWGYRAGWGWQPGWRGPGWQGPGWGGVPLLGAFAAGAIVGGAVVAPAPVVVAPAYGGPCWRRWVGLNGAVHWTRVC
jgi:hypothetical protein